MVWPPMEVLLAIRRLPVDGYFRIQGGEAEVSEVEGQGNVLVYDGGKHAADVLVVIWAPPDSYNVVKVDWQV